MLPRSLVLLLGMLCGPLLWADDMRPASLSVEALNDDRYRVIWKLPVKNNAVPELSVRFDEVTEQLTAPALQLRNNNRVAEWTIKRPGGLAGSRIGIEGLAGSNYQVLVRLSGAETQILTTMLSTDIPSYRVPGAGAQSLGGTILTYTAYGIEHILIGLDHLLFVACLVYISSNRRKLIWAVTGFTAAHSITLALAALDLFRVPIAPVEAVIALSILFLAREIAINDKASLSLSYPVLVSSSFGLLHGFGFAAVLTDIGLPTNEKLTALLCFNMGVEIGQLLFIAALFVGFWLLSRVLRSLTWDRLRLPASYLCGSVACVWMFERLAAF